MYCQNCGYKNQDGAARCRRCGQPLIVSRQTQNQNRYRGGEEPPHAPRPRRAYDDYERNTARSSGRSSYRGGDYERRDRRQSSGRKDSGSSKILLIVLLILLLAAAAGLAAWYLLSRKNPVSDPSGSPVVTVEENPVQTGPDAASQSVQNAPASAAATDIPLQDPAAVNAVQASQENTVQKFASPVTLFETDSYSMTADGYTAYGTNGYGLQVTFINKTGSDVYVGFNQPALNDVTSNIQKAFRSAAGSTQTQILQLGNASGDTSSVNKITLPLVVYSVEGNDYSLPSDLIETGNYLLSTAPVITLN